MNRSQALVIGMLVGFVALVCVGMVVIVMLPYEQLFPPTSTPIPPSPTITPTPTFPKFLPTASLETPVIEPTPTNTRLPTFTPTVPKPPTPTVVIKLPTRHPTDTPVPTPTLTPAPPPTFTLPAPTPVPRQYSISFSADDTTLTKGECTNLKWQVTGTSLIQLNGEAVGPSGKREVCPKKDTEYKLTTGLPGSAEIKTTTVRITVKEK